VAGAVARSQLLRAPFFLGGQTRQAAVSYTPSAIRVKQRWLDLLHTTVTVYFAVASIPPFTRTTDSGL